MVLWLDRLDGWIHCRCFCAAATLLFNVNFASYTILNTTVKMTFIEKLSTVYCYCKMRYKMLYNVDQNPNKSTCLLSQQGFARVCVHVCNSL